MTEQPRHRVQSRFDFGPLAGEYDRWYETSEGRAYDRAQKKDVQRFLRPARGEERLLDIGCGTGHWSAFFADRGYRVTGIDVSSEMIDVARSAGLECSFQQADVYDLPFEDAVFDVTAAMATLEFLPEPIPALREMIRCIRPSGRLLIGTLNRLAPLNQRRVSEGKSPYSSAQMFSPEELQAFLTPWGRVRMAASSPEPHAKSRRRLRRIFDPLERDRKKWKGPFIVAEVRL